MNNFSTFILATLLLVVANINTANAFSISPKNANGNKEATVDRRIAFAELTASAALIASGSSLLAPTSPANAASAKGAEAFVGTFTDPINHPGGKRTIKLLDTKVGDYQLAEVVGGGGRGEPANYVLPAVIIGDRSIIIDFSPKGGPRDFAGVLDKGDIKFLRDGNRWPRQ